MINSEYICNLQYVQNNIMINIWIRIGAIDVKLLR